MTTEHAGGSGPAAVTCNENELQSDLGETALVRFDGVSVRFGGVQAVDHVSLDIHSGEIFALLGPSGCGKSTLLRLLAGFETADAGTILLRGRDLSGVPPHRRPVNMMFQNYALFPHLTVSGNIGFGLRQEGLPRAEIQARVHELLRLVRLTGLGERRPDQLSGGQRQRVALARALAKRPEVLLLDEPMAALDRKLREETQFELRELQRTLGTTFVLVTHDQSEAMTLANRIGIMRAGRLVQVGTPLQVYEHPNSSFVATFMGNANLLQGKLVGFESGLAAIDSAMGRLRASFHDPSPAVIGAKVQVAIRPEKIIVSRSAAVRGEEVAGQVEDVAYLGSLTSCRIRLGDGQPIRADLANTPAGVSTAFSPGEQVVVSVADGAAVLLPE